MKNERKVFSNGEKKRRKEAKEGRF